MQSTWQSILAWVATKGGWAHAVANEIAAAVAAYAAVPAFANLVNNVYTVTPGWFHEIALAAVGIWMVYFNPGAAKKG